MLRLLKISLILYGIFLYSISLPAQDYIADIRHFSVEEGLSHREVYCTFQDSRGYIWMGTKYGLNRFDGYEFQWFTKEKDGLATNEITRILEDGEGWLWLFSHESSTVTSEVQDISLLHMESGEIRSLEERFGSELPVKTNEVYHAISNASKDIFMGTYDGRLIRYTPGEGFKTHRIPGGKALYPVLYTDEHTLLVESYDHPRPPVDFEVNEDFEVVQQFGSKGLYIIGQDQERKIWAYYTDKENRAPFRFYHFYSGKAPEEVSLDHIPIPGPWQCGDWLCNFYYNQHDGTMWYASETRFFVFHLQKGLLFDFTKAYRHIMESRIHRIYFDRSGSAWVNTAKGVYRIHLRKNLFRNYLNLDTEKHTSVELRSCRGIVTYDRTLRVHTEISGMFEVDLETKKEQVLAPLQGVEYSGETYETSRAIPVIKWGENQLLLGTSFLTIYNTQTRYRKSIYHEKRPDDLYHRMSWSIFRDSRDTIWLGTGDGALVYWKPGLDSIRVYENWNDFELSPSTYIYTFLETDRDNMLIGTSSGIYNVNRKKGVTQHFGTDEEGMAYFPANNIYHFYRDREGVIWVATGGSGLIKWRQESDTNSYRQFTIADGLSSNTIYAVYEDGAHTLWLPSEYGLIRFDKETGASKAYLEKDGITHNEFNRTSHYRAEDSTLYFGGLNGVTAFHPKDIKDADDLNIPLEINNFQQYDAETGRMVDRTAAVLASKKITLYPGDRFFTLAFALLEYQDPERIRYAYTIEGQDKDWHLIRDRSLRVSGLNYGRYTLRIKGQSANGQFSEKELTLSVRVLRPFYLQSWFLALAGLSIVLSVMLLFSLRTRQLKRQKIQLEKQVADRTRQIREDKKVIEKQAFELQELDRLKSRFFANISHELRTPLTLILGPLSSLIVSLKEKTSNEKITYKALRIMQRNGKQLLRLIEEILDLSKLEAHKLEVKESTVDFYSFIKRLFSAFESHASQRGMEYRLHYELAEELQLLLDSDKAEKIVNNLLSNAFKYSADDASVHLWVKEEGKQIRIEVQDSGRGIHPDDLPYVFDRFYQSKQAGTKAQGGTGIGLALCKELAAVTGGEIHVVSEWGKGTTFSWTWPKKEITAPPVDIGREDEQTAMEVSLLEERDPLAEGVGSEAVAIQHGDGQASQETYTLLVVEDHDDMRDFIVTTLESDYQVYTARDGEEALGLLEGKKVAPDLILSDVMMPRMDGFTLLEKIKSNPVWRQLPMILLTARAAREDKLQALITGVDDYLTKPFDALELLARIRNLLTNYKERKQWQNGGSTKVGLDITFEEKPESWDVEWLQQAEEIVKRELNNYKYKVSDLAAEMLISERQLLKKMKQVTGLTPNQFIREIKLQKALLLLENRAKTTIAEVAYAVGFDTPEYFSKVYEKRFGKRPGEYLG